MTSDLRAIVADLIARVDALEGRGVRDAPAPAVHAASDADDPFWILNGLKQRSTDPGAVAFAGVVSTVAGPVEWQIGYPAERVLDDDWSAHAPSLAALGNPVRLALLHAVLGGATTVVELSGIENMGTTGQIYHHLNQLTAQGWLAATSRGHYAIPAERVIPLLIILSAARRSL